MAREISIHALREESDPAVPQLLHVFLISIHALREESDALWVALRLRCATFQSTLSVRRATARTERRLVRPAISIHALREESD